MKFFSKPVSARPPVQDLPDEQNDSESGQKSLWYPKAIVPKQVMPTLFTYDKGYPQGAVVHFTAGHDSSESKALDTVIHGINSGYVYLVISPSGKVYQSFPLNRGGSHAGVSNWPGIGPGVSRKLIGIEVVCAGKLDDKTKKSWFGVSYSESEINYVTEGEFKCPTGYYKKFTKAQEESLIDLLVWLKKNNPDVFDPDWILGHHEVSGKEGIGSWRKSDPGGSLSMPMHELREIVKRA
jgi:N-acetyl-anhydromuramyl-L-alanine amidase AmpD